MRCIGQEGGREREGGINGRNRLTECPHHRQLQPLVKWFLHSDCVPFLVGVLHYRMYICSMCRLLAEKGKADERGGGGAHGGRGGCHQGSQQMGNLAICQFLGATGPHKGQGELLESGLGEGIPSTGATRLDLGHGPKGCICSALLSSLPPHLVTIAFFCCAIVGCSWFDPQQVSSWPIQQHCIIAFDINWVVSANVCLGYAHCKGSHLLSPLLWGVTHIFVQTHRTGLPPMAENHLQAHGF